MAIVTERRILFTDSSWLGSSSVGHKEKHPLTDAETPPGDGQGHHLSSTPTLVSEQQQSRGVLDVDNVPNGGPFAWLQVVGSFFLVFNTWGLLNAFGVYQTYYESGAVFHAKSSSIAWIGSLEAFMLLLTGCLTGHIYDKGYLRSLIIAGSFLVGLGHMMLSLCDEYWQVLLAQGVITGLGTGCLFVPCVALLPQYFSTKLGLAMGLAIAGSSLGGVIYPIMLYRLIGSAGFPWAVRIVGFVAMGTLLVPISVLRLRKQPSAVRRFIDWTAFTDLPYVGLLISGFLAYMGLFVLLFYLSYFAADRHITGASLAFYLVPIFNAASCLGRTIPNALSDRTGPLNMIIPGTVLVAVLEFCLLPVTTQQTLIALTVLSGFVSGVLIGILPLCFVRLTKDKSKLGTRMGMGFAIVGFGVLSGGPGGGHILGDVDPLNWKGLWIFAGLSCLAASVGFISLRCYLGGFTLNAKA